MASKKVSESTYTQMQELGSAWVFKRAIKDNKVFKSAADILNDKKTFDEIKKIWKTVGKCEFGEIDQDYSWLESFYQQQSTLLKEIGRPNFTEFCRSKDYTLPGSRSGETFMEWVSEKVKDRFDIGQKDNWNPADIWLIRNENKWRSEIETMLGEKSPNKAKTIEAELEMFNAFFRRLFISKQIMGISLKKISGKTAEWKAVNVTQKFFKKLEATTMSLTSAYCLLGTKKIDEKTAMDALLRQKKNPRTGLIGRGKSGASTLTQDTVLVVTDPGLGPSAKPTTYKIQIKANDSTKFSNLKWEPTIKSKSGARLGKATVDLVVDLMKTYGMKYEQSNKYYPTDKTGFSKVEKEYRDIIDELMKDRSIDFGPGVDVETAIINIKEAFDIYRGQPWVAQSKLQQLQFLYALMTLKEKDRNKFLTSLIFTAEKAGKRYGPYGKLY